MAELSLWRSMFYPGKINSQRRLKGYVTTNRLLNGMPTILFFGSYVETCLNKVKIVDNG